MTVSCVPSYAGHVVGELVGYADCQARALGAWGYGNLASSPMLATLLFTALSIAIALFGLRMLSGRAPSLHDTLSSTAAIAIVLTLLFSWPAMRILIYDTALSGPEAISSAILQVPDVDRSLAARVARADQGVRSLILAGTGREELAALRTQSGASAASEFHSQGVADDLAFAAGRYLMLAATVVSLGGLKLLAGVVIALLPLLALFILFRATAHYFVAAIAGLGALALAQVATSLILVVEFTYLEGWLASTLNARAANYAIASAPIELLLIASLFALLQGLAILLAFRIALHARRSITIHLPVPEAGTNSDRILAPNRSHYVSEHSMTREMRLVASLARQSPYTAVTALPAPSGPDGKGTPGMAGASHRSGKRSGPRPSRTAQKRDCR